MNDAHTAMPSTASISAATSQQNAVIVQSNPRARLGEYGTEREVSCAICRRCTSMSTT